MKGHDSFVFPSRSLQYTLRGGCKRHASILSSPAMAVPRFLVRVRCQFDFQNNWVPLPSTLAVFLRLLW